MFNAFMELAGITTFQRKRTFLTIKAIFLAIVCTERINFYQSGLAATETILKGPALIGLIIISKLASAAD